MPSVVPGVALVLGFGGSSRRHFEPLLAWYAARGFAVELHIASVAAGMTVPSLVAQKVVPVVERVACAPGRHVLHAFSNNGFITLSHVLEGLARRGATGDVAAFVLDSCPGFPAGGAACVPHFFARGLGPMAAAALGLRADRASGLVAPIRAGLRVYFGARPALARHVAAAPARFLAHRPPVPQLLLHGGRDTVVPPAEVEAHAAAEAARGVAITRVFWPEQAHVTGLFREREAYLDALGMHLDAVGLGAGARAA